MVEGKNSNRAKNEELAETVEKMRILTDGIDALIDVVDPETHEILFANKKTQELYGDDIVNRKCYEVFWDRDRPCSNCFNKQILGENLGKTFTTDFQVDCGCWFRATFKAIKWLGGRHVSYGVYIDITEQHKMGEALQESEELFRSIVENSHDSILIIDDNYRIVYANDETTQLSGFLKKELIGQDFRKFLAEESKLLVEDRYLHRLKQEKVPSRYEFSIVRKNGERRDVEIKSKLILGKKGEKRVLTQLLDITERKKIENERKMYEERLSTLNLYSVRLNTASDVTEICEMALDAIERVLGFECAEILLSDKGRLRTFCRRGYPESGSVNLPLDKKGNRKGITVKAAQKRAPIVVSDATKDKDYVAIVEGMKSEVAVPIVVEDKVFGVINVESTKAAAFDEKAVKLLQILVANAAIAIGNILKRNEIKKSSSILASLLKTSTELIRSTGLYGCLQAILNAIRDCGWQQVVLFVNDSNLEAGKTKDIITVDQTSEENQRFWANKKSRFVWNERFKIGEFYFVPWKSSKKENTDWKPQDLLYATLKLANGSIAGVLTMDKPVDGKRPTAESLAPFELLLHLATAVIEKDQLTQQLVKSEKLFRLLTENAQDVIYRIQIKPEQKFEYVSPSATTITGFTPEEFYADPMLIFKIVHPEDAHILEGILLNPEKAQNPVTMRLKRKDGAIIWTEQKNRYFYNEKGELAAIEGIARDVTERKQMEDQLKEYMGHLEEKVEERTRKLKEAQDKLLKSERLAAIGELAAMIGHDLRNPLTSITGSTYYLEKKLGANADTKIKEMLALITKNIEYSNKIINDLLDYSREIVLEFTEKNPKSIIEEILSGIKIPENIRLINLTKNHPIMKVDLQKIKRAFANIITNAIDAMLERGGTLTIASKKTEDAVLFKFTDTGKGISKDVLGKLWTPLFTTKAKGMGFGLAICKRIIEAHGGVINVKSTVGKGTTFTIKLPIEPKTEGGDNIWVNPLESSSLMMTRT